MPAAVTRWTNGINFATHWHFGTRLGGTLLRRFFHYQFSAVKTCISLGSQSASLILTPSSSRNGRLPPTPHRHPSSPSHPTPPSLTRAIRPQARAAPACPQGSPARALPTGSTPLHDRAAAHRAVLLSPAPVSPGAARGMLGIRSRLAGACLRGVPAKTLWMAGLAAAHIIALTLTFGGWFEIAAAACHEKRRRPSARCSPASCAAFTPSSSRCSLFATRSHAATASATAACARTPPRCCPL